MLNYLIVKMELDYKKKSRKRSLLEMLSYSPTSLVNIAELQSPLFFFLKDGE